MIYELIELTSQPTLPSPWSSVDDGEVWVCDDYFFTLQKDPVTVMNRLLEMQGQQAQDSGLSYLYCLTAFYHHDKNPRGRSNRPIMVAAVEQADFSRLADSIGDQLGPDAHKLISAIQSTASRPIVRLFTSDSRLNFGDFKGEISRETAREKLFSVLSDYLKLAGRPERIGDLESAYWHPETGLPKP